MRKKLVILFGVMLVLLLATTVASADPGHNAGQLRNWHCEIAGPHGWLHCFAPGGGSSRSIQVKVFSADGNHFLGTEILIHKDIYAGQPCMTDGGGPYEPLFPHEPNIPYYACHHFDTDHH